MKKMISSLALLFAGAAILCAAPVDANGMFKRYNKKTFAPADWGPNMAPQHAKLINLTVKPSEDPKKSNVLTIDTTKGGGVPMRHVKGIPCKPGDKIIITADVKVAGRFGITLNKYGKKGFLRDQGQSYRLLDKKTPIKFETVLTEDKVPKDLFKIHVILDFPKGKISTLENLKIEHIPAAKK